MKQLEGTQLRIFEVGDVVYEPYRPQRYGKVGVVVDRGLSVPEAQRYTVSVRWKGGGGSQNHNAVVGWTLRSLEELVADHEKKLRTHRANLEAAREIQI